MGIIMPLNKKVIVEPEIQEKKTPGGIFIPESASGKTPTRGKIICFADDSEIGKKVSVGDDVLFSKFSGVEIVLPSSEPEGKDRKLMILKDEDILAVIKEKKRKDEYGKR